MTATQRLTDTQVSGLEQLLHALRNAETYVRPGTEWIGAREGVSGTTIEALERKGLAEARWVDKPYPRIVGKITEAGLLWLQTADERRRAKAARG